MGIALTVLRALYRAKIKGWLGEKEVSGTLRWKLDAELYRVFDDLYLPRSDGKGTTQVDHVVVSKFGVFVIETKNFKGWIFGKEKDGQWTKKIGRNSYRFQNPLRQNELHVKALEKFLGLGRERFHSVVYFVGGSTFKTKVPENVIDRGLLKYVEGFREELLAEADVRRSAEMLEKLDAELDRKRVGREHVEALRGRMRR
ncbi:MAG: nuclease-related domain-containing protein [Verrucomicrobiales bacterium]|nr:nuclease-related domain-containing protein [Verrucomicrobiales bacterium]